MFADYETLSGFLNDLFLFLLPQLDKKRIYSMQEATLGSHLIKVYNLNTDQSRRIKNWNNGDLKLTGQGNLGAILYDILYNGHINPKVSGMTLYTVNQLLNALASTSPYSDLTFLQQQSQSCTSSAHDSKMDSSPISTPKSSSSDHKVQEIIYKLFHKASPIEAKWLIRIILKNHSPINFTDACIFSCIHPFAKSIYELQHDFVNLSRVLARMIVDGHSRDKDYDTNFIPLLKRYSKIQVGTLISFMNATRPESIAQVLYNSIREKEEYVYAEIKYDGERMQIHVNESRELRIFSKSGRDSTKDRQFVHNIILEKSLNLSTQGDNQVKDVILEAELLIYDEKERKIEGFGGIPDFLDRPNKTSRSKENRHPMLIFFDVLYLNGECLLRLPFDKRREILDKIIQIHPTVSEKSEFKTFKVPSSLDGLDVYACQSLTEYFYVIDAGNKEGLMVKGSNSLYYPGKREKWSKLKRGYLGLGETAEYAVIGGTFDSKQQGFLGLRLEDHKCLLNVFHVGCLTNKKAYVLTGAKPILKYVFSFSLGLNTIDILQLCESTYSERFQYSERVFENDYYIYTDLQMSNKKGLFFFSKPVIVELVAQEYESFFNVWKPRHPVFSRIAGMDRVLKDTTSYDELQKRGEELKSKSFKELQQTIDHLKQANYDFLQSKAKDIGKFTRNNKSVFVDGPSSSLNKESERNQENEKKIKSYHDVDSSSEEENEEDTAALITKEEQLYLLEQENEHMQQEFTQQQYQEYEIAHAKDELEYGEKLKLHLEKSLLEQSQKQETLQLLVTSRIHLYRLSFAEKEIERVIECVKNFQLSVVNGLYDLLQHHADQETPIQDRKMSIILVNRDSEQEIINLKMSISSFYQEQECGFHSCVWILDYKVLLNLESPLVDFVLEKYE